MIKMKKIKDAMMKRMIELDFNVERIEEVKYDCSDILDENLNIINELINDGMTLESAISYVLEVLINDDDEYEDDYDYYY